MKFDLPLSCSESIAEDLANLLYYTNGINARIEDMCLVLDGDCSEQMSFTIGSLVGKICMHETSFGKDATEELILRSMEEV